MSNMFDLPIDFKVKKNGKDEENGKYITVTGFANTTTVDRVGDIILAEAWTKGGLDNYLKNPIILAYHNHSKPIGKMTDYYVNSEGFNITAQIYKTSEEVYSLIKNGVLKTFSVGFRTREADYDTETDLFVIKDLELMEVSVVSIPANADSTFSVKKSFKSDAEYDLFKSEFIKSTDTVNADEVNSDNSDNLEEIEMGDTITKAQIEAELRAKIEKENKEKAAAKEALERAVSTEVEKGLEKAKDITVEVVGSQVETLKEEMEKRLGDESTTMQEAIDSLRTEIKDFAEEYNALMKSKMTFTDKGENGDVITDREKDQAMLVSKILNVPVEQTKYGQALIEKAGTTSDGAHQTSMTYDWEIGFSTRLFEDIREKLIIEPLFTGIAMPMGTMNIPLNPEATYGTWVTSAQLGAATSSGTAKTHGLTDTQLQAHKLATKELLTYEEEDDSLIALIPIIRDAAVRRMAKSSDKALLRGAAGSAAGAGEGNYPFDGLATIGNTNGNTVTIGGTVAAPAKVFVADLRAMRRQMGVHGHSPSDLVFVVNHTVYFDLLDDPEFQTMDKVGSKATVLTGQIGMVGGSPVVVSGEFAAPAINEPAAICVNMSNYIKGDYKSLIVERERSVENQTNLLVVTRRFGMLELFPSNPTVVTLLNPAT